MLGSARSSVIKFASVAGGTAGLADLALAAMRVDEETLVGALATGVDSGASAVGSERTTTGSLTAGCCATLVGQKLHAAKTTPSGTAKSQGEKDRCGPFTALRTYQIQTRRMCCQHVLQALLHRGPAVVVPTAVRVGVLPSPGTDIAGVVKLRE